jgi:hypothetical protein
MEVLMEEEAGTLRPLSLGGERSNKQKANSPDPEQSGSTIGLG